jgi:hypothetical protein
MVPARYSPTIVGGFGFSESVTMRLATTQNTFQLTDRMSGGTLSNLPRFTVDTSGAMVTTTTTETFGRNGRPTSLTGTFSLGGFSMTERLQFGGGSGRMVLSNMVGVSNRLVGIPPVNNNIFSMQSTQRLLITAQEYGVRLLVMLKL